MEWVKLGVLCDIKGGSTPKRSKKEYWSNGTIPWVKISDLQGKYINKTDEFITTEGFDNSSVNLIEKGSLLYTIFATVGKVGILDIDATTNQAIVGLKINDKELINRDYLYYYLISIENSVKKMSRGVAQNNINIGLLKKLKIPVPALSIQQKIVDILDEAQALIDKRKEQIALLDKLAEAIFYDMFGDPIKNDKGWEVKKWGNVLIIKNGKNQAKVIDNSRGKYPICGSGGIMGYATDYITSENSVIIGRKGNINKPILMKVPFWNVDTAFGLEVDIEKLNVYYLYYFCLCFDFNTLNKTVTIPSLRKSDLVDIRIPLPPLALQNEFAEKIEKIEAEKKRLEDSLKLMEDNYNNLMQRAFKGEIFN